MIQYMLLYMLNIDICSYKIISTIYFCQRHILSTINVYKAKLNKIRIFVLHCLITIRLFYLKLYFRYKC